MRPHAPRLPTTAAAAAVAAAAIIVATAHGADPPATAAFLTTDATTFQRVGGSGSDATIVTGGKVTFTNKLGGSIEEHDVTFFQPDVSCEQTVGGVNSDPRQFPMPASAADWSGVCTFSRAGPFPYVCNLHEDVGMSGTITVVDPTTAPPPPPGPPPTTMPPGAPPPPGGAPPTPPGATGTQLAIKVSARQRGFRVRGTITGAKRSSRATIALTAKRGDVRAAGARTGSITVGRLNASTTRTGRLDFSVRLNRKARAALLRRGRLAVAVRVAAPPLTGATRSKTFRVTLRRAINARPAG